MLSVLSNAVLGCWGSGSALGPGLGQGTARLAQELGTYRPESIGGFWLSMVSIDKGDSSGSNPGLESAYGCILKEIRGFEYLTSTMFDTLH